jgi:hypothetical protein
MGVLCLVAAVVLLKMQIDDTSVWAYLLAIQLFIIGGAIIAFGYDSFIHG